MKKKVLLIGGLLVLTLGGGAWYLVANVPPSKREPVKEPEQRSGLVDPTLHTERVVATAETVMSSPTPQPSPAVTYQSEPAPAAPSSQAPLRMYTSTAPEATPTPAEEHHGFYAPSGRLVRCKLVNTVDSSALSTPIIGEVTDDLMWDGHLIIGKCSEVHAIAQVDKARERIASEGAVIFVLYDAKNPGLGKELVVKGEILDREDDPQFQTYGITNASAGLRGMVITSDNMANIKLFVATFISGIAGGLESTQNTIFGQQPTTNGTGVGNLPGTVINPMAQGAQAVLDRYAQIILDGIERDGFFIRVPSSKTFYVYIREPVDTGKATVGGSSRLAEVQESFLQDRKLEERVTEPRAVRDERAERASQNPMPNFTGDPQLNALTNRLDQTSEILQERSREVQTQSLKLGQPNPTPIPQ
jgi:hypothetical protein